MMPDSIQLKIWFILFSLHLNGGASTGQRTPHTHTECNLFLISHSTIASIPAAGPSPDTWQNINMLYNHLIIFIKYFIVVVAGGDRRSSKTRRPGTTFVFLNTDFVFCLSPTCERTYSEFRCISMSTTHTHHTFNLKTFFFGDAAQPSALVRDQANVNSHGTPRHIVRCVSGRANSHFGMSRFA